MEFSAKNQETSMGEEEVKPICEFCGKRFKNVRALCGHKRSHSLAMYSKKGHKNHEFEMGIQDNHQTSSDSEGNSKEKGNRSHSNLCHKCDKGFKSLRALHVHMRSHSKRKMVSSRLLNKDLKLPNNLPKEKRSVRRYKINTCSINYYSCPNWNHFSYGTTTSSSVSIVDEQELKEIASSLLMLAKGGFYSADNVSVDSEFVEPSCNDFLMKKVKVDDLGTNSDAFKIGSVSVDEVAGFLGYNSDDCKISQEYVDCRPSFTFPHDSELYTTKNKDENTGIPQGGLIFEDTLDSKPCEHALEGCKCELTSAGVSQVGSIFGSCDHSIKETMCGLSGMSGLNPENNSSVMKHICKICDKGFPSGQALGGHRMHCPKRSFTRETKIQSEIVKLGSINRKKKRAKTSICSVCCREFGSGQALGGHMRAHLPGNSQSCEKKNDAFDHDSRVSEGEVGLNHVHNPHSLPALVPVA